MQQTELLGTKLFSALGSDIAANTEDKISINTSDRVSLQGQIATGIFFNGNADAFAAANLQVLVGLGDESPVALADTTPAVPEPSTLCLALFALCGGMVFRARRNP